MLKTPTTSHRNFLEAHFLPLPHHFHPFLTSPPHFPISKNQSKPSNPNMKINFPTFFVPKEPKLSKNSKKKPNSSSFSSSSSSEDSVSSSINRSPKTVLPTSSSDFFDGDKITARDLETVIRRLGQSPISDEELSLILAEIAAEDGCIELDSLAPKPSGPGDLRDAFAVFDADGDGRISAEELLGVFVALGDDGCTIDLCRRMIGAVDSDGDGFVCFQDFVRLMDGQRS